MFALAPIFTDHMVLQREKTIRIFGTASEGTRVRVSLAGASAQAEAVKGGFSLTLPAMHAGGPYTITAQDADTRVTFTDVYVGEVWLAGGQSNMEWPLKDTTDAQEEIARATPCGVRFFQTPRLAYFEQEHDTPVWQECTRENCPTWSAVGYYFAKELAAELGVMIGVIGCNLGGTSASAWISRRALIEDIRTLPYVLEYEKVIESRSHAVYMQDLADYEAYAPGWQARIDALYKENPTITWAKAQEICGLSRWPGPTGEREARRPGAMYDTMIRSIAPYTIRGFLYYQGESDEGKPEVYERLLRMLIAQWRKDWQDESLPFIDIQLPIFIDHAAVENESWAIIRQAQMDVCRTEKNCGLVPIFECGEWNNIHPREKRPVAHRAFLQAMALCYGGKQEAWPPMPLEALREEDAICVTLSHAQGLTLGEGRGFEISGADGAFMPARAQWDGVRLILRAAGVLAPIEARYAWYMYGPADVRGGTGLPMGSWRVKAL